LKISLYTENAISLLKELEPENLRTQLFHPIFQGAADQKNIKGIIYPVFGFSLIVW